MEFIVYGSRSVEPSSCMGVLYFLQNQRIQYRAFATSRITCKQGGTRITGMGGWMRGRRGWGFHPGTWGSSLNYSSQLHPWDVVHGREKKKPTSMYITLPSPAPHCLQLFPGWGFSCSWEIKRWKTCLWGKCVGDVMLKSGELKEIPMLALFGVIQVT